MQPSTHLPISRLMATAIPFAAMSRAAMSRAAAAARALGAPVVKVCAAVAGAGRKPPAAISRWVLGTGVVARYGARLGAAAPRPTIEHFKLVNLKVAVH
jgi:sugar phosphate isomerase/epimerase